MLNSIFSTILILLGIGLIFFIIKECHKTKSNEYDKIQTCIDLSIALSYVIIGILVLLKILSGRFIIPIIILFTILEIFIKKKLNQIIKLIHHSYIRRVGLIFKLLDKLELMEGK